MDEQWTGVAALGGRSRRALYDYVRRAGHAVSREEAADAARMSRNLAAFHLDKLVDAGLLRARYEAAPDRPRGRGRTPKVYEATAEEVAVTIPERRYQLIAEILADAVASEPAQSAGAGAGARRGGGRRRTPAGGSWSAGWVSRRNSPGAGPACSPSASAATARVLSRGSPSRQAAQLTTTSSTQVRQARSASGNALVSAPTSQSRRCEPPGPTRVSRPASTRVG